MPIRMTNRKSNYAASAGQANVDWVKTSTGYAPSGATLEDLRLMRQHSPAQVQVKAAGGIRDLDKLLAAREIGVTRVGASATAAMLDECRKRLGLQPIAAPTPATAGVQLLLPLTSIGFPCESRHDPTFGFLSQPAKPHCIDHRRRFRNWSFHGRAFAHQNARVAFLDLQDEPLTSCCRARSVRRHSTPLFALRSARHSVRCKNA